MYRLVLSVGVGVGVGGGVLVGTDSWRRGLSISGCRGRTLGGRAGCNPGWGAGRDPESGAGSDPRWGLAGRGGQRLLFTHRQGGSYPPRRVARDGGEGLAGSERRRSRDEGRVGGGRGGGAGGHRLRGERSEQRLRRAGQGRLDAVKIPCGPIAETEHKGASEGNPQGHDDESNEQSGLKQRVQLNFVFLIHARCFPLLYYCVDAAMDFSTSNVRTRSGRSLVFLQRVLNWMQYIADFLFKTEIRGKGY